MKSVKNPLKQTLVGLVIALEACMPVLKENPDRARENEIILKDSCRLESYVKGSGPVLIESDKERKQDTYLLVGRDEKVFRRLVDQLYNYADLGRGGLKVTVAYDCPCGKTLKKDEPIYVRSSDNSVAVLPYHICMQVFFYGKKLYQTRQRFLKESEAEDAGKK